MNKGFTLTEVLLVLLIMSVIAMFAIPAYQRHLISAHRQACAATLLHGALGMEAYYHQHHQYEGASLTWLNIHNDEYYQYSLTSTAHTFALSATPTNRQSDRLCGTLSIHQTGQQLFSGTALQSSQCW